MLQVSNKNGNVSDLINESLGSLGEIISNGKINGIYTLRKLIAQEYYFFKEEDIDYTTKNRTVKTLHANQDVDDVSFDVYDAWPLSALVKDYIESMDKIDKLQVSKDDLGNSVTKIIGKRKLTGLSLIFLFQQKYLNFISMVPSFEPILKKENITGDVILIGIYPELYTSVPNIEDLVNTLIIESYEYSNTEYSDTQVFCIPIDMLSGSASGSAKDVLKKAFEDKKTRAELPEKIEASKDINELYQLWDTCKKVYCFDGEKTCQDKIKKLEKIEQDKKEAKRKIEKEKEKIKSKIQLSKDLETLLDNYDKLIDFYEKNKGRNYSKYIEKIKDNKIQAEEAENSYKNITDIKSANNARVLFEGLESTFYSKERIQACKDKAKEIETNILNKIEEAFNINLNRLEEKIKTIDQNVTQMSDELEGLGLLKVSRKNELRANISDQELEKERALNEESELKARFNFVSALLGKDYDKKITFGNDEGQGLLWRMVAKNEDVIVLFGFNIFNCAGDYSTTMFNNQEQGIIDSVYVSVNDFKKANKDLYMRTSADADTDLSMIYPTENYKRLLEMDSKRELEAAVDQEFRNRMSKYRDGYKRSSKAITSQPLVSMIRKDLAPYHKAKKVLGSNKNRPVVMINFESFLNSDYCKF